MARAKLKLWLILGKRYTLPFMMDLNFEKHTIRNRVLKPADLVKIAEYIKSLEETDDLRQGRFTISLLYEDNTLRSGSDPQMLSAERIIQGSRLLNILIVYHNPSMMEQVQVELSTRPDLGDILFGRNRIWASSLTMIGAINLVRGVDKIVQDSQSRSFLAGLYEYVWIFLAVILGMTLYSISVPPAQPPVRSAFSNLLPFLILALIAKIRNVYQFRKLIPSVRIILRPDDQRLGSGQWRSLLITLALDLLVLIFAAYSLNIISNAD